MERFTQRESLLLGYTSPQRFFASPNASNKSSDVDFHDVFGGPPRRTSFHDMRYSFTEGSTTDRSSALKRIDDNGGDGDDEDDEGWSGLNEKPVFGEESVNRRGNQSDDFFDDIFRGSNSVTSSPSMRVVSPAWSLPPKSEPSTSSSMLTQFSLPPRLTKGVDLPAMGSSASRTASLSRFSNQSLRSPEDSRNGSRSYIRQSSLSRNFSYSGGERSPDLPASDDKVDTGGNLEEVSKSKETPTSSTSPFQFHFSIYKWASKGVPMVMPLRGRHGSRVGKRTQAEDIPSTDECAADNESTVRKSPKSTLPNVDFPSDAGKVEPCHLVEEAILPVAESENLSSLDNAVEDVTVSYHTIEDIEPRPLLQTDYCEYPRKETPVLRKQVHKPDPKPIRSLFFDDDLQQGNEGNGIVKAGGRKEGVVKGTKNPSVDVSSNTVEDVSLSIHRVEDIKPHPSLQTDYREFPRKESPLLGAQVHKPDLEPVGSLFFDDDLQQGNDEVLRVGGRKESVVKGMKKSSVDVGSNKIAKNQNGKRVSLTNTETDKAIFQDSPKRAGDNLGKSKVKGKVKDFVKMFNQEVRCKPTFDGADLGSPSSKLKDKGTSERANDASITATRKDEALQKSIAKDIFPGAGVNEASISTPRMYEALQKSNVKGRFPDAAANEASIRATRMYEEALQEKSNVKDRFPDASIKINEDLKPSLKEDCEAKTANYIGSVPNISEATAEDADDSFQMKELAQDDSNREEIRAIDYKIRNWSRGKEGNIRSLLTTMQYVLWPESGWKTVPLVDIIEGNAVKRSYQKALLYLHPDKLQQKGASEHQKYVAAKVFEILQEAWDHFNSLGSL